jgi:predicted nucleotidyltransferase
MERTDDAIEAWLAAGLGDSPECLPFYLLNKSFGSMHVLLEQHHTELSRLCALYGVRRLAVFGSAARSDFDPDRSDVDLYVEFSDTSTPGYSDRYLDFALAVEQLLGRPVDLVTPRSLANPYFERSLRADQVELYAA